MCHSKILQFLVSTSIFIFSSSILATVHDFGNLLTISDRNSLSDLNIQDSTYSGLTSVNSATDPYVEDYSRRGSINDSGNHADTYKDHNFQNKNYDDLSARPLGQEGQNKYYDNTASVAPISGFATVTAPIPEPETYAMILAGLAMIVFTARRRN